MPDIERGVPVYVAVLEDGEGCGYVMISPRDVVGRKTEDCALPTDSNRVSVVVERLRQDSLSLSPWGVVFPGKAGMWMVDYIWP